MSNFNIGLLGRLFGCYQPEKQKPSEEIEDLSKKKALPLPKNTLKFDDLKPNIMEALKERVTGINEPVSIVDGFLHLPIQEELSGTFYVGGPGVPLVMLLGESSAQIYCVALKALLPDLEV